MEPPVARSRSAMTRSSVVLPQPDGPISDTKSPLLTVRLMSLSAVTGVSAVWNTRLRPAISTAGWRAAGETSAPLRSRSLSILATASSPGGLGQHGAHQHIASGGEVVGRRILDFVMGNAILARHEHHANRRHARDIAGVVPGARYDVAMGIAQFRRRLPPRRYSPGRNAPP